MLKNITLIQINTISYILLSSLFCLSYANNEFIKTDLQLSQLKGPIQNVHSTFYNENDLLNTVWSQYYDAKGFLYMSIINTYNPMPSLQLYQWTQFYKGNRRDFFTLLNEELTNFFPITYAAPMSESFKHQHITWTAEGAITDTLLDADENSPESILSRSKCFFDHKNRMTRLEIITGNKTEIRHLYYLSFAEYLKTDLSKYEEDDIFYVSANQQNIENYVENQWLLLDPRVEINYVRYTDWYGNPIIEYKYNARSKQKIFNNYTYYPTSIQ